MPPNSDKPSDASFAREGDVRAIQDDGIEGITKLAEGAKSSHCQIGSALLHIIYGVYDRETHSF